MDDRDDRAMMLDPQRWPAWPLLPLKRYTETDMEVGCIVEVTNDWLAPPKLEWAEGQNLITFNRAAPRVPADVDALLAAGWRVD